MSTKEEIITSLDSLREAIDEYNRTAEDLQSAVDEVGYIDLGSVDGEVKGAVDKLTDNICPVLNRYEDERTDLNELIASLEDEDDDE